MLIGGSGPNFSVVQYNATVEVPPPSGSMYVTFTHNSNFSLVLDEQARVQLQGQYGYQDAQGFQVTALSQRDDTGEYRTGNRSVFRVDNISYTGGQLTMRLVISVVGI